MKQAFNHKQKSSFKKSPVKYWITNTVSYFGSEPEMCDPLTMSMYGFTCQPGAFTWRVSCLQPQRAFFLIGRKRACPAKRHEAHQLYKTNATLTVPGHICRFHGGLGARRNI